MTKKKKRKPDRQSTQRESAGPDFTDGYGFCLLILLLLPLAYFFPYLTDTDRMIFGTDWIPTGGYARFLWQKEFFLNNLSLPMWMPQLFSGFSSITAYGDTFFYPMNLLTAVLPLDFQRVLLFAVHAAIGGAGTFFFLRFVGCSLYPALFAGVAYEFTGVMMTTTYAGHLGRMIAVALLPVSFYLLLRALRNRSLRAFLLFGGFLGLYLLGGHFQMSYLALVSMFFSAVYYIMSHMKNDWSGRLRVVLNFGLAVLFASCVCAVKYLPMYAGLGEGARGVERGYEYATSWSLPLPETFDLVVPNFSGILDNYWGLNYFKLGNEYPGILPLLLAVVAVVVLWRKRWVTFFAIYSLLFLLFSYGGNTPFYELPYHLIPLVSKFRGPAMLFFMVSFGMVVLSGIGLDTVISDDKYREKMRRTIGIAVISLFALSLLVTFMGDTVVAWITGLEADTIERSYGAAERMKRMNLLQQNLPSVQGRLWIASFIALALFGGLYLLEKGTVSKKQLVVALILVTVVDQWSLDRHYLRPSPAHERLFANDDVVTFLNRDPDIYRVFPIQYRHDKDGLLLLNDIESIGGYGANPPKRYQRFIGAGESVMFNPVNLYKDKGLLDILNVRYLIVPPVPSDLSSLSPVEKGRVKAFRAYLSGYTTVFSGSYTVYSNPDVLPRAFVAHKYTVVENEEAALALVVSPGFDHHSSVVLEDDPGFESSSVRDALSPVEITEHDPHRLISTVDLDEPGVLVVSENYHSDWRVFVDGEEKELLHADYVLKGVAVGKGRHEVEFVYRSLPFRVGEVLTLFSFAAIAFLVYGWRRGKN